MKLVILLIILCVNLTSHNQGYDNYNLVIARDYQKQKRHNQKVENRQEDLNAFMDKMSIRESSHRWKIINDYGYMGKYQFGWEALKTVGYKNVTVGKFVTNPGKVFPPEKQDKAFKKLFKVHWKVYQY